MPWVPLAPLLRLLRAWHFLPDKNFLPFGKNLTLVSSAASLLLRACLGTKSKREMPDLFTAGLAHTLPRCLAAGRAGIASRGNQLLSSTKPRGSQILLYPQSNEQGAKTPPLAETAQHLRKSHSSKTNDAAFFQ